MPSHAYTVEPTLYSDPVTGETKLSYDVPTIKSSAGKEAALEYHNQNQHTYVQTDAVGNQIHDYDHLEIDQMGHVLNHATGDIIETEESEQYANSTDRVQRDLDEERWSSFTDTFYEQIGGEAAFDQLLDWAETIADDDFINDFNASVDNNDQKVFLECYELMVNAYNEKHNS